MATNVGKSTNTTLQKKKKLPILVKKKYLQIYCSKRADCPLLENRCVMDWGETPSTYIGKYFEKDEPSDLGPPSLLYFTLLTKKYQQMAY